MKSMQSLIRRSLLVLLTLVSGLVQAAGTIYYVHPDALGTPQAMTNQSGQVVWSVDTTPFGQVVQQSGVTQPMRFPGQYADPEAGFSYNYHRDYDPSLGRYVQSDPIGLEGGANTYGYVQANPTQWIDSLGLIRSGHHEFPQEFWRKYNLPREARQAFDKATIPPGGRHGWSKEHAEYNRVANEEFQQFCKNNDIDPSRMTADDANKFLNQLRQNPAINRYNQYTRGPVDPSTLTGNKLPPDTIPEEVDPELIIPRYFLEIPE